jgi:hypothetical protein
MSAGSLLLALAACQPAPGVAVVATRDLGPLETSAAVRARDGGYSMSFEGHSVWAYGDTILAAPGADGVAWRDNTWSSTLDLDATDGVTGFTEPTDTAGAPEELFPETPEEAAYNAAHRSRDDDGDGVDDCEAPCGGREVLWPKAMVAGPDGALLFYIKIHGEPGAWNFFGRGSGIATWSSPDAPVERHATGPDATDPTLLWPADQREPGEAALLVDDTVYAYACNDSDWHTCHVARAPWSDVLDPDAWAWWDGAAWTPDDTAAAPLFDGSAQLSVHWSEHLGAYRAVYDSFDTVELRTAPAPEGPWSAPVQAFDTLAPSDGFTYCGMAHPELAVDGGRLEYVSYYRSTGDWTGEVRLVEVELAAG